FAGAAAIGFGTGLFSVGTMIAAMALAKDGAAGIALGAWGAVQASCAGLGIALGGLIRDGMASVALADGLGATLADRATGYGSVYTLEIIMLLGTLVVLGPLVGTGRALAAGSVAGSTVGPARRFGLQEFPA
ncbi:MAG: PucC family protein, partial [Pseudomonadota bacterium]